MTLVAVEVVVHDAQHQPAMRIRDPLEARVRASFGAMRAACWVDLGRERMHLQPEHGRRLEVRLDGRLVFRGQLAQRRAATDMPPWTWYAEREPARTLNHPVTGLYTGETCSAVLAQAAAQLPDGLVTLHDPTPSSVALDRLEPRLLPFPYVVDLLAKLAGNRIWDLDWEHVLRWRPHDGPPDHTIVYDPRRHALRLWRTDETVRNTFQFYGGPDENGSEFRRGFEHLESVARYGRRPRSLFVRAISTQLVFALLEAAVLEQAPHETNRRWVDFRLGAPEIDPGDTLALRNTGLPAVNVPAMHRARTVDHRWRGQRLFTRIHLAAGWESGSRYTRYIDHDVVRGASLLGRFALDLSALDSAAHLDA